MTTNTSVSMSISILSSKWISIDFYLKRLSALLLTILFAREFILLWEK